MSHETNLITEEPLADRACETSTSHVRRLQILGRRTLATAGISLAVLAAWPAHGKAASEHMTVDTPMQPVSEPITAIAEAVPAPLSSVVRTSPFEVGITAYSSLTDDNGNLFNDMQAVGMNGARLSLTRTDYKSGLAELYREVPDAQADGIDVAVNLGDPPTGRLAGFPQWAAQMAADLPNVHRFVIENEVNNPDPNDFWAYSMQTYIDLLYKTTQAIHAVRPDAIVSGFGLDSQNDPVGYLKQAAAYAYQKYNGLQYVMDTLSQHLYLSPDKDEDIINQEEMYWGGPINVDEFGRIVANSGQRQQLASYVTPDQQAADDVAFINWAASNLQVENVFNYRFMNSVEPQDLKTGIVTTDGVKLPAYYALQNLLAPAN